MKLLSGFLLVLFTLVRAAVAADALASGTSSDGTSVPYILTANDGGRPTYAVVLMPGGTGIMSPRLSSNA